MIEQKTKYYKAFVISVNGVLKMSTLSLRKGDAIGKHFKNLNFIRDRRDSRTWPSRAEDKKIRREMKIERVTLEKTVSTRMLRVNPDVYTKKIIKI